LHRETLEPEQVERDAVDQQHIAVAAARDCVAPANEAAQRGQLALQSIRRPRWWLVIPQDLHQPVVADHLSTAQHQRDQQPRRMGAADPTARP
jgi:hypothetical protein